MRKALAITALAAAAALGTVALPLAMNQGVPPAPSSAYRDAAPGQHTVVLHADGTLSVW
ncbi:MAG: hypothetical protein HZA24_01920 [Nitrospirae bacterium]|nr:hypothetical protein [Nitrospirota bacterium]